jgi:8-oxo-dGTP pyrophosphatase MutT (NUDIX family)
MVKQAGLILITREVAYGEKQLLVTTNRHYGQYALPGGKVEMIDRDPLSAARRELKEETTILTIESGLTYLFHGTNTHQGSDRDVYVYFARNAWGHPHDIEEGTTFAWFNFWTFLDHTVFASFYKRHLPNGIDHLVPTRFSAS